MRRPAGRHRDRGERDTAQTEPERVGGCRAQHMTPGHLHVTEQWVTVPADVGEVRVRIVKPVDVGQGAPVVLYVHGGGWILGNAGTHDRLVRELAVGADAVVAFVEYDRSPEARDGS
ncbi:alpha/beta hydrolase family protein [Streptomyces sp. PanSC9]|nr:alpha/beta hydrolase family protein [Streptomyces sp. PanSC9]